MFENKYFLVFITLCLLFLTVSSVSAVEDNVTDDLSFENVDIGSYVNDKIVVDDSDKGTFNDLNNLIGNASENSEIKLDKDYMYNDSSFKNGITIRKALIVDGQGHSIDANHQARIFNINHNNVILKNLTFLNGYVANDDGGAIFYSYSISNCSYYKLYIHQ